MGYFLLIPASLREPATLVRACKFTARNSGNTANGHTTKLVRLAHSKGNQTKKTNS